MTLFGGRLATLRFAIGTPPAHFKTMKVLTEYGRIAAVYMSFVGFLATEILLIVAIYRLLGIM